MLLRDRDGLRHAIRIGSVVSLSDADPGENTTVLLLPGGQVLIVPVSLDELLAWFD